MAYFRRFPWLFRRNVSEEMLKAGCSCNSSPISAREGRSADRLVRARIRFLQMRRSIRKEEPSTPGCSLASKASRPLRSEFAEGAQQELIFRLTDFTGQKEEDRDVESKLSYLRESCRVQEAYSKGLNRWRRQSTTLHSSPFGRNRLLFRLIKYNLLSKRRYCKE